MKTVIPEVFADRREAGHLLARRLLRFSADRPVVLALPRGGVPVAFEVARALDAPLDLLIVRKIGAPGYEELGIGAVVDGDDPQLVLNEDIVRRLAPSPEYIRREMNRQLQEIERRRKAYIGNRRPIPLEGRTVIVVDDGIATGGTIKAALRGIRKTGPAHLVLAVPVAPQSSAEELANECDEFVCLKYPNPFYAVGAHYQIFDQTEDAEVVDLMKRAERFGQSHDPRQARSTGS